LQGVEDLDLSQEGTFVQEFVHNPLLIDGYKFDIGIYTTLTSVDPLRLAAPGIIQKSFIRLFD
jgi:tubulin monoglycylase TTLL15